MQSLSIWLSHLLASSGAVQQSSSTTPSASASSCSMTVTSLHRYAVKGLSGDSLEQVTIQETGETFPDDRRFALLLESSSDKFHQDDDSENIKNEWLHKENFLCAFSDPEFLALFQSSYRIVHAGGTSGGDDDTGVSLGSPHDTIDQSLEQTQRRLTLTRRNYNKEVVFDNLDLQQASDRARLGEFLSEESGKQVRCVTGSSSSSDKQQKHTHQFGNTSSGWKQRGDTRTIHIINQATVDDLSQTLQIPLRATRFRPNLVLEGVPAWSEFDWVQNQQQLVDEASGLTLTVISKTVRCKGVSVDPDDDPDDHDDDVVLDIPKLLTEHYPQYGPYLGVYAVVDAPGSLQVGSVLTLREKEQK